MTGVKEVATSVAQKSKIDLSEFDKATTGTSCRVCQALSLESPLAADQQAKLREAIRRGYQHEAIARVLKSWGIPVVESSVRRHKRNHG